MSKSNTNYYNLCSRGEIGEGGYCDFHRPGWWKGRQAKCIPSREYLTRRGVVQRKPRYAKWSRKSWHSGPPAWWWRAEHRRARAKQKAEFLRCPEDPTITPDRKLIDLWGWY